MEIDLQYNLIILGIIVNAMALLNLLNGEFYIFIALFITSNAVDLYKFDNK